MKKRINVLIIEDSALMRRELTRIINADKLLRVIDTAWDGEEGIKKAGRLEPDVVTIDLNLPDMDGITCLQYIMIETPRPCIMISAHTGKNSLETFEALELGAVNFVEKPSGEISLDISRCAEEITAKIKEAALANLTTMTPQTPLPVVAPKPETPHAKGQDIDKVVTIGVSTGGPRTLMRIIPRLPAWLAAPVLVIQHMPPRFTAQFAQRLDQHSELAVREAQAGDILSNGVVYVAPGGYHLTLRRLGPDTLIQLAQPAKQDAVIPSVNKALMSAIEHFGSKVVGVILTGMGDDGADAMHLLHGMGGVTIAESQESAVIFGMPAEVISRKAAGIVTPVDRIAEKIVAAIHPGAGCNDPP